MSCKKCSSNKPLEEAKIEFSNGKKTVTISEPKNIERHSKEYYEYLLNALNKNNADELEVKIGSNKFNGGYTKDKLEKAIANKTVKEEVEDEVEGEEPSNEGWKEVADLDTYADIKDEIQAFFYEVDNCVRGSYTGAETFHELAHYIYSLSNSLENLRNEVERLSKQLDENKTTVDDKVGLQEGFGFDDNNIKKIIDSVDLMEVNAELVNVEGNEAAFEVSGDWKHDHLRLEYLLKKAAEKFGYTVELKDSHVHGESDSDWYDSTEIFKITKMSDAELGDSEDEVKENMNYSEELQEEVTGYGPNELAEIIGEIEGYLGRDVDEGEIGDLKNIAIENGDAQMLDLINRYEAITGESDGKQLELEYTPNTDDEAIECEWCGERFAVDELHNTDLGMLCDHCIRAIRSRGEEVIDYDEDLSYTNDNEDEID